MVIQARRRLPLGQTSQIVALILFSYVGLVQCYGGCRAGLVNTEINSGGTACSVCQTDQQCIENSGNSLATCSNDFHFSNISSVKWYQCTPVKPDLVVGLLTPNSIAIRCFTGLGAESKLAAPPIAASEGPSSQIADSPAQNSWLFGRRLMQEEESDKSFFNQGSEEYEGEPYCDIGFEVKSPKVDVECRALNCSMTPESTNVACTSISCVCGDNGACANDKLVDNIVKSAKGKTTWMCADSGACVLSNEGFIVPEVGSECETGECLLPSEIVLEDNNEVDELLKDDSVTAVNNLNWNPVIAAIPTIVLAIVISWVGYTSWKMREFWAKGFSCTIESRMRCSKVEGKRVQAIEFKNLAVFVPMDEQTAERKRTALRGKALTRHGTMHTLSVNTGVTHSFVNSAKRKLGLKTSDDIEVPAEFVKQPGPNKAMESAQRVVSLHNGRTKGEWCILSRCNGSINAGEVVGVLGPSGCGKTTLLSVITGSAVDLGNKATIMGDILIDGEPRKAHEVAYVPQSDHFIPTLTVRECVKYSALLRLPRDMSADEINKRVEMVLIELGIQHLGDSQVGGSGKIRGISGGERRRVTIAMELVTDPSIIVLDEPTSGLDSYTAMTLIRCLRQVAEAGRVVVASLHQPSKDMYYALDKVMLMGHGRLLYMGRPEEANEYMQNAGVPCPQNAAMAEHMLQVASNPESIVAMLQARERSNKNKIKNYSVGSPNKTASSSPESESLGDNEVPTVPVPKTSSSTRLCSPVSHADLSRQLSVMFWRTLVDIIRNPTLLTLHVSLAIFTGVITGAIFYQLEDNSIGVQNRMGGTFFALAFLAFTSLTTVDLLMNERSVVLREVRSNFYRPSSYLISKLALDGMLLRVIPAVLYWIPFYYMAGFNSESAYAATYAFVLIAFNCAVGALSMVVTIACNTAGQSSFIMNFILLFSLAFTGFLVNVNSIPAVLRWIHYLSVFFYAFEAIVTTELNGQFYTFLYQSSPTAEALEIPDISGETFLSSLGFNTENTTNDIAILVGIYYGFIVLALLFFLFRIPRTKSSADGDLVSRWYHALQLNLKQCKLSKVFSSRDVPSGSQIDS